MRMLANDACCPVSVVAKHKRHQVRCLVFRLVARLYDIPSNPSGVSMVLAFRSEEEILMRAEASLSGRRFLQIVQE